jgi:hypothetical protein
MKQRPASSAEDIAATRASGRTSSRPRGPHVLATWRRRRLRGPFHWLAHPRVPVPREKKRAAPVGFADLTTGEEEEEVARRSRAKKAPRIRGKRREFSDSALSAGTRRRPSLPRAGERAGERDSKAGRRGAACARRESADASSTNLRSRVHRALDGRSAGRAGGGGSRGGREGGSGTKRGEASKGAYNALVEVHTCLSRPAFRGLFVRAEGYTNLHF